MVRLCALINRGSSSSAARQTRAIYYSPSCCVDFCFFDVTRRPPARDVQAKCRQPDSASPATHDVQQNADSPIERRTLRRRARGHRRRRHRLSQTARPLQTKCSPARRDYEHTRSAALRRRVVWQDGARLPRGNPRRVIALLPALRQLGRPPCRLPPRRRRALRHLCPRGLRTLALADAAPLGRRDDLRVGRLHDRAHRGRGAAARPAHGHRAARVRIMARRDADHVAHRLGARALWQRHAAAIPPNRHVPRLRLPVHRARALRLSAHGRVKGRRKVRPITVGFILGVGLLLRHSYRFNPRRYRDDDSHSDYDTHVPAVNTAGDPLSLLAILRGQHLGGHLSHRQPYECIIGGGPQGHLRLLCGPHGNTWHRRRFNLLCSYVDHKPRGRQ